MKLVEANQDMVQIMMSWINSPLQLTAWAGSNFRHPFTLESFTEDLRLGELASYCLLSPKFAAPNDPGKLIAFGQFYKRIDKCHLARLLVAPQQRGKGLVKVLIKSLSELGRQKFDVNGDSLFVVPQNTAAIQAYRSIGFEVTDYPERRPIDDYWYMIRT